MVASIEWIAHTHDEANTPTFRHTVRLGATQIHSRKKVKEKEKKEKGIHTRSTRKFRIISLYRPGRASVSSVCTFYTDSSLSAVLDNPFEGQHDLQHLDLSEYRTVVGTFNAVA